MNTGREAEALRAVWNRILLDPMMKLPDNVRTRINELFEEAIGESTPSRQPSDAAVEAADRAYFDTLGTLTDTQSLFPMRDALEAAYRLDAPRPLLDRDAVKSLIGQAQTASWGSGQSTNDFVDAVMELARPMPTREQIAQVLHDQNQVHAWDTNRCDDACGIAYYQRADAVLALLNGAES